MGGILARAAIADLIQKGDSVALEAINTKARRARLGLGISESARV
jgi:hypothetical protein